MSSGGPNETPTARPGESPGVLRTATRIAVVVGATGSLALMLYIGRRNPSFLLLVLFTGWVLSPFVALLLANRVARLRRIPKGAFDALAFFLSFGSLAIYATVYVTSPPKPAFWFLVVPFGSWLLLGITALVAGRLPRRGAGS